MNILLIGGTGLLSNEIMNQSVSRGYSVSVLNRGNRKDLIPKEVQLIQADINNTSQVESKIQGLHFDVVVDFICYNKEQVERSISLFKDVCSQYVFISSAAVYADIDEKIIDENSPLINPKWQYSVDKAECEKTVNDLCKEYTINYTIIRPAVTYGNTRIPYRLMPSYGFHWTLISRIINNKPILIWNNGQNAVTILRVEDFAVGMVGLFGNHKAYNGTFNITGDEKYSWKDILDTVGQIIGKKPIFINVPIEFVANEIPNRKGEILVGGSENYDKVLDNSKIKRTVTDFKTTIFLQDGLKKTIEYYKENNFIYGIDYGFDAEMDRVIIKYLKLQSQVFVNDYNLSYIDYLKTNNLKDKLKYYFYRYRCKTVLVLIKKYFRLILFKK